MDNRFEGCGVMFWYALFVVGFILLYYTGGGQALLFQVR